MAINVSKVVVGGLAAGVVGNIVGYVAFGTATRSSETGEVDANASGSPLPDRETPCTSAPNAEKSRAICVPTSPVPTTTTRDPRM